VEALAARLADADAEIAQAAARSLGRIGNLEAVAALEKALASAPEGNRLAIAEGLLRGAEVLRTQGQRKEAEAVYERLKDAPLPAFVRDGARRAQESLRPRPR
jgi:HEAT repeat protein